MNIKYTIEELMLNDSFLDYCNNSNSIYKNYWEQIISEHPDQSKIIKEAKQLLSLLSTDLSSAEVASEINKIREIITGEKNKNTPLLNSEVAVSERLYVNTEGRLRSKKLKRVLAYSVLTIALIGGISYLSNLGTKPAQENKNLSVSTVYKNPKAARKQVVLPDGSVVILNSNSDILISPSFNIKDRKVQLSGEAFFKVKKDADKPFIVINREFSVTALGTSFYVYARDDKNYSVNLLEGKVKIEPTKTPGKEAYLTRGQEAQWLPAQTKFTKQNFDTLALKQWVSGKISFNKTPVKQAIKHLEKWYGVNIEMQQNKLENVSITGDYVDVPLDDVLKVICFSLSCKYSYSGTKIIIE